MKIKLTSGDGAELILDASNPVEFGLSLADKLEHNHISELTEISKELYTAYQCIENMVEDGNELEDIIARHRNPMNPDENFDLTVHSI
jgi:hypothetical protein